MSERLSPGAERLVSAGKAGLEPSAADIERVRGRILASVAAGVAAGAGGIGAAAASTGAASASAGGAAAASTGAAAAASGSAVTAGGLGLVKVVVVAAVVTGASVTGGVLVTRRADPPPVETARPTAAVADASPPRPRPLPRGPVVEPLADPGPDASPVAPPVAPPVPPPAQPPPERPSLASEMDLLRRARAALRAGDPRAALEHLERHAGQFPGSPLAPEAAAIRIEATCAVGDRETARALADRFVLHWPDSPLARRVPRLCGETP